MNRQRSGRTKGLAGPLRQKLTDERYAAGFRRVLDYARAAWQVL